MMWHSDYRDPVGLCKTQTRRFSCYRPGKVKRRKIRKTLFVPALERLFPGTRQGQSALPPRKVDQTPGYRASKHLGQWDLELGKFIRRQGFGSGVPRYGFVRAVD